VVFIELQEWAFLVQLLTLFSFELLEALVQELEEHKHAIGINEELREVNKLIDAVGLEMLQHVNEEVGNYHCCNDSVSVIFISIIFKVKEVFIFCRPYWLLLL
jgi:hypothetical protein